ncbi:MAG: glutathione S-transferase [Roseobacter sp.]
MSADLPLRKVLVVKEPVLYSFRRCPYAMRARLALLASGTRVELREVVLRDKPVEFLDVSASKTVPCLVTDQGVIDESLDIMIWALRQRDPLGWLQMPEAGWEWIARCDGPFKQALDRTKYATRYPDSDAIEERAKACVFLKGIEQQLDGALFGKPSLADAAILPFVRQFAFIDKGWFDAQSWPKLHHWLAQFLDSSEFSTIMPKQAQWTSNAPAVWFPSET